MSNVVFSNGVTMSLNMVGGASYPCRTIHVILTKGEILEHLNIVELLLENMSKKNFLVPLKQFI